MKKLIIFILTLAISIAAFAIPNFDGINWGDTKESTSVILKNPQKYPSINPDIEILTSNTDNESVESYRFYFKNNKLFKIRVFFDKNTVGKDEMRKIYKKLVNSFGNPIEQMPINEKISSLTIRGNYIKFSPDLRTDIFFIGIDTLNKNGKMTDSNLYLDYLPASKNYKFEI